MRKSSINQGADPMKMSFLDSIPYICEQWAKVVARSPESPFIAEEVSEHSFTRQQVDELAGRVYGWLLEKGIGAEDFVMIRFPRDARPFIAMLGVWKAADRGDPRGLRVQAGDRYCCMGRNPQD